MPTISRFYGIKIEMFWNDKHGPHFHVKHAEYRALVSIRDGSIMRGKLPQRAYSLVLEWLALHRQELNENWKRARVGLPLNEIEGLE
jgi:hypothetical protein